MYIPLNTRCTTYSTILIVWFVTYRLHYFSSFQQPRILLMLNVRYITYIFIPTSSAIHTFIALFTWRTNPITSNFCIGYNCTTMLMKFMWHSINHCSRYSNNQIARKLSIFFFIFFYNLNYSYIFLAIIIYQPSALAADPFHPAIGRWRLVTCDWWSVAGGWCLEGCLLRFVTESV